MIFSKKFAAGLLTGAVVGGAMAAILDPMKDKDSKKLKKGIGDAMHSMGDIMDDMKK